MQRQMECMLHYKFVLNAKTFWLSRLWLLHGI
ncbi:hypothetical protein APA386B_1242 [Acetobacter pasteurianus 386B]|nr:hypothetical protein APA386B_1242 [Acetobacter pasteurianus 386B]